ncbi:response regulator [Lysobacter sp. CFH 32150]|uniref:response regulator n=1 Tax=Lysobacter sp. CFH 32150 TaxID=2927128 RepID=UPI001FA7A368|nr:response regulator [Lysobacter sp. CFH 32150]MCI4568021.1 response regulator [Lysobacter sp. CFH 32150]
MAQKTILLVEDNPDDIELTRLAFAEANIAYPLTVVRDGAEALDWLFARGRHAGRDRHNLPVLILLDLNLPKLDGRDVVQAIRADPTTRAVPVVALTSSVEPPDIDTCYALGVNSYLQKPADFAQFVWAVKQLGMYWLELNQPTTE